MALRWWLGAFDGVWRKTNHQNFAFINANQFCQNRMSIFFHMLLRTSCASKWYQWLRIWLSRNIHFVGTNVGMSAFSTSINTWVSFDQAERDLSGRSREAWKPRDNGTECFIALKFDGRLSHSAAKAHIKFQSDTIISKCRFFTS